jgi:probable HAF family extracellular repeat protein
MHGPTLVSHGLAAPHIAALALLISACAPDSPTVPTSPSGLVAPSAARVFGITTIPIIPPDLTPGAGTIWGFAYAINEAGVVAGRREGPDGQYAFTWKDGVLTSLGANWGPAAINRFGQVLGNDATGAFIWKDGERTPLGTFDGSIVTGIDLNDKGQVVGVTRPEPGNRAFIWENGTFTDLGTLGGSPTAPTSINNRGQVVGNSRLAGSTTGHAFLWERGVMTDIGSLAGGPTFASAINDRGDIVGLSSIPLLGGKPYLWQKGVMTRIPIPGLSDFATFQINDISNAGHVVGASVETSGLWHAFVWRDGVYTELPAPGDRYALGVNSSGEIAGYSTHSIGMPGAWFWSVGRQGP